MRFCVLASGSAGNATYVESEGVRLLIDAGISCRAIERHLADLAVDPDSLDGILITHEHEDHVGGLYRFAARHQVAVYANEGTAEVIEWQARKGKYPTPDFALFQSCVPFALGDLVIQPVRISHDTAEPVAYTLTAESGSKLGYFTDLGYASQEVVTAVQGCETLILESNHDLQMLRTSGRPYDLVARISGKSGHLSNDQACDLMRAACPEKLRRLILAHLSRDCNEPAVARYQMAQTLKELGRESVALAVAQQAAPLEVMAW